MLVTRRLQLRPLTSAALRALHAHWSHEEVGRWMFDGEPPPLSKVEEELGQSSDLFAELGLGIWGLYVPMRPRLIGTCGFLRVEEIDEIEILFSLDPDRWHQGLAREASQAVLDHAFKAIGLERVVGRCDVPNEPSRRLLERLGMQLEKREAIRGIECYHFGLSREEHLAAVPR
jgi:RimJ/RimL family protein N-acetyltransferase